MTYAPEKLKEARAYLKGEDADLDDNEVGIVGGPSHITTGTSYHLGYDQLKLYKDPYSWRTARDRSTKSNAASAVDIDDDLDEMRELMVWIVQECRRGAPDTLDIREVLYSPDGITVLQWDRERGQNSEPRPHSDLSHRGHGHISYYRDSEHRDKVGLFKRFYAERAAMANGLYDPYPSGNDPDGQKRSPVQWIRDVAHALIWGTAAWGTSGPLAGVPKPWIVVQVEAAVAGVKALLERPPVQPAPVDPAVLKAVLMDPEVLAAQAKATNDDAARRQAE